MKRSALHEKFLEICKRRRIHTLDVPESISHQASTKCEFKSECYYKKKYGVEGFNKPKRVPNHPTKSHMVVAKFKNASGQMEIKVIYFGQKGVQGEGKPKSSDTEKEKKRRQSFKARHAKNIAKGKSSAAYWADKVKW